MVITDYGMAPVELLTFFQQDGCAHNICIQKKSKRNIETKVGQGFNVKNFPLITFWSKAELNVKSFP